MAQWEDGVLKAVWYQIGKRSNDDSPKLKRANFDVLNWCPPGGTTVDTFVVPLGYTRITDEDLNDQVNDMGEIDFGQEFGFYSKQSYVIEQHEHDGSDSIFGLNGFGYV